MGKVSSAIDEKLAAWNGSSARPSAYVAEKNALSIDGLPAVNSQV